MPSKVKPSILLASEAGMVNVRVSLEALSFAAYASELASLTADPKQVAIFEGQEAHGINLLLGETELNQEVVDVLLRWLDDHLN